MYNDIHPVTFNSRRKYPCTRGLVLTVHKIYSPSAPKVLISSSRECVDVGFISKTTGTGNPKQYYILKLYLMIDIQDPK